MKKHEQVEALKSMETIVKARKSSSNMTSYGTFMF